MCYLSQADINQSADEFEAQLLAQRRENEVRVRSVCLPASINVVDAKQQQLHLSAGQSAPHRARIRSCPSLSASDVVRRRLHHSQLDCAM